VQRGYWHRLDPISETAGLELDAERWHAKPFVLASHATQCSPLAGNNRAYIELRMSRSPGHFLAMLLAGASALLSALIAVEEIPLDTRDRVLAVLVAALPGALVSALSREASQESRRVTDGPLALAMLVSILAVAMAVAGLAKNEQSTLVSTLATWSAAVSVLFVLLLVWNLVVSRLFDGPSRADSTYEQAKNRIRSEKIVAAMYAVAMIAGSVILGLELRG